MRYTQERLEEVTNDDLEFVACPECGTVEPDVGRGVVLHYAYNHEGSISGLFKCVNCGKLDFGTSSTTKYCSKDCEIEDRHGTVPNHHDKEWLEEQLFEEDRSVSDIADECGCGIQTLHKWIAKHDIEGDYDCPSCERNFYTSKGRAMHHKKVHGESIAGFEYTCENCGDTFVSENAPESKISPKYCSSECYGGTMEGENNPNKDPERKKKISEGMKKAWDEGKGRLEGNNREWMMENVVNKRDNDYLYENNNVIDDHLRSEPVYVEETDRKVRSTWEAEVDLLLHESDFDYEYEPRRFDIGNRKYMPDFIVGDIVIEVKGYVSDDAPVKAEKFMEEHPQYKYLVVGSEIPCDVHIEWKNRDILVGKLRELHGEDKQSVFDY